MNKNVAIILIGALVASFVVAMIVQAGLKTDTPAPDPSDAPAIAATQILVAKNRIPIGREIKKADTEWRPWPKDALYDGVIERDKEKNEDELEIYGKIVRRSVEKGEPVTSYVVLDGQASSFVTATLMPGMRAYSIPVSAATSVSGFVRPGDHVDVIVTYAVRLRGGMQAAAQNTVIRDASQTVLSNIRVLAIDQKAQDDAASGDVKPGRTVTLEVSKEGAEKLALASRMGDLSLALRRLGDEDEPLAEGKMPPLTTDVFLSTVVQEVQKKQRGGGGEAETIRIYSGRDVHDITVRGGQ
ncbi:MAG: Flp pilus assembly protein CpaB [Micavibrio sp.]|jgi:pilus assembly protein CpaB|nr:MAG: Flp pilus assembly protein CpaB [Micavibrio sp.]